MSASRKRFRIDSQGDPVEFLAWFLHELHRCVHEPDLTRVGG